MSSINRVIKETFKALAKLQKSATPIEYQKIFCKEALKLGVYIEDCNQVKEFLERLPFDIKRSALSKNIKSEREFISFLIGELNRFHLKENREFLDNLLGFVSILLEVIVKLHNKEASNLAKSTIARLTNLNSRDFKILKLKWREFEKSYDDKFFDNLSRYLRIDKSNLKETVKSIESYIRNMNLSYKKDEVLSNYKNLSNLLITSTIPSITSELNTSILTLDKKLKGEPNLINALSMQNEIKSLINRRKELDRKEFIDANRKAQDILMNLIQLSNEENFKQRVLDVKGLISTTDEKNLSLKKMEILKLVSFLEKGMDNLTQMIEDKQDDISSLEEKVKNLESKIDKLESEKEKFENNLISKVYELPNVKALESKYKDSNLNYSVAIIRADNHSHIINKYGEKTWSAVTQTLKKITTKGLKEDIDVLTRMDIKTFILFLHDRDAKDVIEFCIHIKDALNHSKFVYKGENIETTVSIGVANRDEDEKFEYMMKVAMDRLKVAKKRHNIVVSRENMAKLLKID